MKLAFWRSSNAIRAPLVIDDDGNESEISHVTRFLLRNGFTLSVDGDGQLIIDSAGGFNALRDAAETTLEVAPDEALRFDSGYRLSRLDDGDVMVSRNDVAVATEYPYNARSSTVTATIATVTSGNANITLPANATLADGGTEWRARDGVFLPGCGPAHAMPTPAPPICTLKTQSGDPPTTGAIQLEYQLVAVCDDLGLTAPSTTTTVSNAPAYFATDLGERSDTTYTKASLCLASPITLGNNSRFADGRAASDQGTTTNRWLLIAQAASAANGLYTSTLVDDATVDITTRSSDCNTAGELFLGRRIVVHTGTVYALRVFRINVAPTVLDVDPVTFVEETFVEVQPYIFDAHYYATGNLDLASVSTTSASVDRVDGSTGLNRTIAAGEVLFLPNQTATEQNGLYVFGTPSGGFASLTRVTTYNQTAEMLQGSVVRVEHGTSAHRRKHYVQTSAAPATVDTSPVTYAAETALWYAVYRRRGGAGSWSFVGAFSAQPYWISGTNKATCAFRDYGEGPMGGHTTIPSTVPSAQRNKGLRTRLATVSGTAATLTDAPSASASNVVMYHDNKAAFDDMAALTVDAAAGTSDGISQYWPPGTYNFIGARLRVTRAIIVSGYGRSTRFRFFGGSNLRTFNTNTQDSPASTRTAAYTKIENMYIICESGLPEGAEYASKDDRFHGAALHLNARAQLKHVRVSSSTGTGIVWDGRDVIGANCNCWYQEFCLVDNARGHGYAWQGSDANAGINLMCSAVSNYGHGFYDGAFLNNKHETPHTEDNWLRASLWDGINTRVDNEYSEGGQSETAMSGTALLTGGLHGAPVDRTQGLLIGSSDDVMPFTVRGGAQDSVNRSAIDIGSRTGSTGWVYRNHFDDATPGLNKWNVLLVRGSFADTVEMRDPSSVSVQFPLQKRRVTITGQSAVIGATDLYSANPPSGHYVITATLQCTTGDATAGIIRVKVNWDGRNSAESKQLTTLSLLTAGVTVSDTFGLYSDGAHNISYEVELAAGAINAARFALEVTVELKSR